MQRLKLKKTERNGLTFVTCEGSPGLAGFVYVHTENDGPRMMPRLRRALREFVGFAGEISADPGG